METKLTHILCAVICLTGSTLGFAQVNSYPNLGQNPSNAAPAVRNAGQINMGGQSCASGWGQYQQRFASGFWADRCQPGQQLVGLHNVSCTDVVRPDGRPQANYVANGSCVDVANAGGGVAMAPQAAVVAPTTIHHYSPHQQFNPPTPSPYWRAGYTANTACMGPVMPLAYPQSSAIFNPMQGYAYGPGQSNNDLPVVLKNPYSTAVMPNLVFAPHGVVLHGSAHRCAALSFVAPAAGTYQFYGSFHQTGHKPGVPPHPRRAGVFIGTNGGHAFSGFLSVPSGQTSAPFNLNMPLVAGQEVHFMSNVGGALNSNTVGLTLNVQGP